MNVWLPLSRPILGIWPTTQACALTGKETSDLLLHSLALNPLSHTSQGKYLFILRERGWKGERQGEKHKGVRETPIGYLLHAPQLGTGSQPRHVPRPGIKLVTFCFLGQRLTN